ncbi:uncharacterized protein FIESC28_10027 [Fusarium coffeatum]|uniref:Ipa protein n=1 Tax=Fusarium coffeatum TaxID=231269 RepID=A0A366QVZ6_9HYPO|nr:uncharacterized protein FIESC28_10027 [Fusarium coffeatum]RBR09087.1 hypothetical protein FIESC28_10027 [Fusarium coffeatum]
MRSTSPAKMEPSSLDLLRELHGDLKRKWKAHGPKVETAWRSFNKPQRAECMETGAFEGKVLKHSRDTSLGNVCWFIPEWNLEDITDPESNLLLDILKHRATKSLSQQYRSGHNGTAGDLDLIEDMARTRNMRPVGDFENCFTVFCKGKYGFSFHVNAGQKGKEFLSGLESAFQQRKIIPQSLGELILRRQLVLLQILNIMIETVLHEDSETRDRSQLAEKPKPTTTPLPSSVSKQATAKLNSQDLSAIASDQKSSLQEYLSLLRTEPDVLCSSVSVEFFSRPELLPDEKGRSLSVHTDRYIGPAVFETIHNAFQGIASWDSITGLLDLLAKLSADKLYKSMVLQELSNMCHFEYARTQALFRRHIATGTGSKWFKRLSNVYDRGGNAKLSMKCKPEELTRSDPQLHYLLRLCQPETTISQAVEWMQKLTNLYKAHPLERESLFEKESRTLYDMAAIVVFVQDLSAVYSLPSSSRKKGTLLVARLQEVDVELGKIKKEVDLRDFAAPIINLIEPGVSQKALEALDQFVIEKTDAKMGSMYQDEMKKAFQDIEGQYQKAKEKLNKHTKADLVPMNTTHADAKDRIETQKRKEKTRPEHSSVYKITKTTDFDEENKAVEPPSPVNVSPSTAQVFATIFDKAQSRGSLSWTSFESAMAELGFSVLARFGSVYTFRPSEDMDIKRSINIHRPHQSQIEGYDTLILARRLSRAYGWNENSFVTE